MAYKIVQLTLEMPVGEGKEKIHPTLIIEDKETILVDCGFTGALPQLQQELKRHGIDEQKLTALVLTHHDHDHMGTAALLKQTNPNIKIYATGKEEPSISAKQKPLRLQQAEEMQKHLLPQQQAFGKDFCAMLRRVEPVEVDVLLQEGDCLNWCGGCRVLQTPGHTPGHLSLWMEKENLVITGDAMVVEKGKPAVANPQFALDLQEAEKSFKKLLNLKAGQYYCYHGGIYLPVY